MFGGALCNFALGLIVFERTNSPFLYALFLSSTMIPAMIIPMIAGPFIDRYSRRKIIYTIDFIFFAIFALASIMAYVDYFNYMIYLGAAVVIGTLSSVYNVAYDSFYPTLISKGNYTKAYSIGSLLYPLANTFMVPVAAVVYQAVGLFPLMLANAVSFLVAAICETQIKIDESQTHYQECQKFNFTAQFKEGFTYLKSEKGLLAVTMYFVASGVAQGIAMNLFLPFFEMTPRLGTTRYSLVMSSQTAGRIIAGLFQYKIKYPVHRKYQIAIMVYSIVSVIDSVFLFTTFPVMMVLFFGYGMLGATSYNIRISATQSYIPNEKRGRFNGIFAVLTSSGMVLGGLIGGLLGEFIYLPYIVLGAALVNMCFIYLLTKQKKHVVLLYNRDI